MEALRLYDDGAGRRLICLPGGRRLRVRRQTAADLEGLEHLYRSLSTDDLRYRFFVVFHPSRQSIRHRLDLVEASGFGLVAAHEHGNTDLVAQAECMPLPNGNAEFCIVVSPAWRGWLGPWFFDALLDAAAAERIPALEADILADNSKMLALVRRRHCRWLDSGDPTVRRAVVATDSGAATRAA